VNECSSPEPRPIDPLAGELVTQAFDYDGGRLVSIYVPPDSPEAIVFGGDGQLIAQWGACLEAADVPATTANSRWPSGFDIPTDTAQYSRLRPGAIFPRQRHSLGERAPRCN